jgi:hypothetical protein
MSAHRSIGDRLLTFFGDLKVYPFPMFFLYDPGSYMVRGEDAREAITLIKPGDIVLRGYRRYIDGYFIPGYFSHAGLYIGEVNEQDKNQVRIDRGRELFRTGEQMIIHAMADGVFMEDFLSFCRCDFMVILRFPDTLRRTPDSQPINISRDQFQDAELTIYDRLVSGSEIELSAAIPVIRLIALQNLGREYDFNFNFNSFDRLSCTEFVYFCTKSLSPFINLKPVIKRILFVSKQMIIPDAYLAAGANLIWSSRSTKPEIRLQIESRQ